MTYITNNRYIAGLIIDTLRPACPMLHRCVKQAQALHNQFEQLIHSEKVQTVMDLGQALWIACSETTQPLRDNPSLILDWMQRLGMQSWNTLRSIYASIVEIVQMLGLLLMMVYTTATFVWSLLEPVWDTSDMAAYMRDQQMQDASQDQQNAIALAELERELEQQVTAQIQAIQAEHTMDTTATQAIECATPQPTQANQLKPDFGTMRLSQLRQWASDNGITKEQIRFYGSLRLKKTWLNALQALA